MSKGYGYTFRHKDGYHVIAQSWTHFYKLQSDRDYIQIDYNRLGTRCVPYMRLSKEFRDLEKSINDYFEPLSYYVRTGNITTGIQIGNQFSVIRIFLKYLHNHACMIGDRELLLKVRNADRIFWDNEEMSRHALPLPKTITPTNCTGKYREYSSEQFCTYGPKCKIDEGQQPICYFVLDEESDLNEYFRIYVEEGGCL